MGLEANGCPPSINPICLEFQQVLASKGLPLHTHLTNILKLDNDAVHIPGSAFALTSKKLITRGTNPLISAITKYREVFGYYSDSEIGEWRRQLALSTKTRYSSTSLLFNLYKSILLPNTDPLLEFAYGEANLDWGTCASAEKFFIYSLPHYTRANCKPASVIVYKQQETPVLYQKIGSSAYMTNKEITSTAINLVPIKVNGIFLPEGTLMGINSHFDTEQIEWYEDHIFHITQIKSVQPLRLTLFSLPAREQAVAFGANYSYYLQMFSGYSGLPDLADFRDYADQLLKNSTQTSCHI